jgi:hypothetical protein
MRTAYDALRQLCNLSQQDAADYHAVRLDTVIAWCNDRRNAPIKVIDELRKLHEQIVDAGEDLAEMIKVDPQTDPRGGIYYRVGLPLDDRDSRACGFPTLSSHHAAIGVAIACLPKKAMVELMPRERGAVPTALIQFADEADRDPKIKDTKMHGPLLAQDGAKLAAKIQYTSDGPQASYLITLDSGNNTYTQSDIRLFKDEAKALEWVEAEAMSRGFAGYSLRREDEDGRVIKQAPMPNPAPNGFQTIVNSGPRPSARR